MGTIVPRGDVYRAVIRKAGHKPLTKSFPKRALAKAWIIEKEAELAKKDAIGDNYKISELVRRYIDEVLTVKGTSKTSIKSFNHLSSITKTLYLDDLNVKGLLSWKQKQCPNISPGSLTRYLTRLGTVLKTAEVLWDIVIPWRDFRKAKFHLKTMGMLAAGNKRTRRVAPGELDRIKANLSSALPMSDIIDFAITTALRGDEIVSLLWTDLNNQKRTILVRNRKHPTKKIGNDSEIPLLGDAMSIIGRQPIVSEKIFPYNRESVGAAFRRAVKAAGISDFTFHDLRHEGISRLFELGYSIPEVALVSGHHGWNSLEIYTNLKPESLHRS